MHHPVRASRSRAARRLPLLATALTLSAALLGVVCPAPVRADAPTPAESVNPFLGTGGHGHTYPGASAPFGMVQLSPGYPRRRLGWLLGVSLFGFVDSGLQPHASFGNGRDEPWRRSADADRWRGSASTSAKPEKERWLHFALLPRARDGKTGLLPCLSGRPESHGGTDGDRTLRLPPLHVPGDRSGAYRPRYGPQYRQRIPKTAAITVEDTTGHAVGLPNVEWLGRRSRGLLCRAVLASRSPRYGLERNGERLSDGSHAMPTGGKVKAFRQLSRQRRTSRFWSKSVFRRRASKSARRNLQAEIPGWDFDTVHAQSTQRWNDALSTVSD